jgi:hypothetical protein
MSDFLDESSTFEQVLEAISARKVLRFCDIPEHLQNGESASSWLSTILSYGMASPDPYYAEVPVKCRTDKFLRIAATLGCRVLKDTHPEDTGIYRELAVAAVSASRLSLKEVSPAFRDEEMLEYILKRFPGEIHSLMRHVDWLVDAMTDDQFDRCCEDDFMVALDAPAHRIKGDISRYLHLGKLTGHEITYIRLRGRLDVMSLKLKEGKWPFPQSGSTMMPREPESMEALLGMLEKSDPGTPYETVYMACIMRFPIEEVIAAMSGSRLKKLLIEMYSPAELRLHMKQDNGLKAVLLDDAMGF